MTLSHAQWYEWAVRCAVVQQQYAAAAAAPPAPFSIVGYLATEGITTAYHYDYRDLPNGAVLEWIPQGGTATEALTPPSPGNAPVKDGTGVVFNPQPIDQHYLRNFVVGGSTEKRTVVVRGRYVSTASSFGTLVASGASDMRLLLDGTSSSNPLVQIATGGATTVTVPDVTVLATHALVDSGATSFYRLNDGATQPVTAGASRVDDIVLGSRASVTFSQGAHIIIEHLLVVPGAALTVPQLDAINAGMGWA